MLRLLLLPTVSGKTLLHVRRQAPNLMTHMEGGKGPAHIPVQTLYSRRQATTALGSDNSLNFTEAVDACSALGAQLSTNSTIDSSEDDNFVTDTRQCL